MTMKVSEREKNYNISKITESNVKNRMKYQALTLLLSL